MANRSRLLKLVVRNIGCIGPDGVEVALDDVVCLVGKNNAGKSTILRAYELAESPNKFSVARDRCRWTPDDEPSVVELDVHIPAGIMSSNRVCPARCASDRWKTPIRPKSYC